MKTNKIFITLLTIAIPCVLFYAARNAKLTSAKVGEAERQSYEFALLAEMPKDKNYMVSPFSLKMALAMAANGADGATKHEILNALEILDIDIFNKQSAEFIKSSNDNEAVEFNIANSIWHNTDRAPDLKFSDMYKNKIQKYFNGQANEINNENGAKTINDWIALQTKDKIKDVVDDEKVKKCVSFLVNTIYFKGDWDIPFKPEMTSDDIFTDRIGDEKTTSFMSHAGDYLYFENSEFQLLAKPYKDNDIKMYFVLPKNDRPVTADAFDNAVINVSVEYVYFKLPKFKTEYLHENLIDILKRMGVTTAFDANADFMNMYAIDSNPNIFIALILQKTFIEVDEKGTEAAAATVIGIEPDFAVPTPEPIYFICDRPFTYFIRDDKTGDILFMGEYAFVSK